MMELRKSTDRGHVDHGWLKAKHSFSFASYYDPQHMHFRNLRVINQDIVSPAAGFGTHPHNDMEIITYVIRGAIKHKDSMGNEYVLKKGELQVMSAGTGITHSEFNASTKEELELLQIWVLPDEKGHEPRYDQKIFPQEEKKNRLSLNASKDGRDGSLQIHQDVDLYSSTLDKDHSLEYNFRDDRYGWIQVVFGELEIYDSQSKESQKIKSGDGLSLRQPSTIKIAGLTDESEFLLFDLN